MVRAYRFGEFVLDESSGELRKGCQRIRLRPQPAAALTYLLQRPGTVVSRDELRRALWPEGTFVDFDHGLNSCIKQIRAALSDERRKPRYVETLPRRGYRFIQPVVAEEDEGDLGSSADFSLSGSVRVSGQRVRVALHLADRSDARKVWTTCFERHLEQDPRSEEDVASSILHRLVRGEPLERS